MKNKFLPPIKRNQVVADSESPKGKVNFNLPTIDPSSETKRPLITHIEMENVKSFNEEDMKGSEIKGSPTMKKILKDRTLSPNAKEKETLTELDFDEGLFLLQKTFNLKTTDILQNLKV